MGMLIHWACWWGRRVRDKEVSNRDKEVRGKKLWISWEPTGRTLKIDKGKKTKTDKRKKRENTQDNSCHHGNSHFLSTCYVTCPGLDALSTFNLTAHSPMNWAFLSPLLMGELKLQNIAVTWLLSGGVRIGIQTPVPIFFPWGLDAQDHDWALS